MKCVMSTQLGMCLTKVTVKLFSQHHNYFHDRFRQKPEVTMEMFAIRNTVTDDKANELSELLDPKQTSDCDDVRT